jgi:hypothetical protein
LGNVWVKYLHHLKEYNVNVAYDVGENIIHALLIEIAHGGLG